MTDYVSLEFEGMEDVMQAVSIGTRNIQRHDKGFGCKMMVNQIRGGKVLNGETGCFERIDIELENGRIKEMGLLSAQSNAFDADGLYVIPGFIDTHIHGSMGSEFASESESFDKVKKWFASKGITALPPPYAALSRKTL